MMTMAYPSGYATYHKSVIANLVRTRNIVYTSKGTWFTLFKVQKLLKKARNELANKKCNGTKITIHKDVAKWRLHYDGIV